MGGRGGGRKVKTQREKNPVNVTNSFLQQKTFVGVEMYKSLPPCPLLFFLPSVVPLLKSSNTNHSPTLENVYRGEMAQAVRFFCGGLYFTEANRTGQGCGVSRRQRATADSSSEICLTLSFFQKEKKGRRTENRSEERRVGKECSSRWSQYH